MSVKTADHHLRTQCRLCDSKDLERIISLAPTPPANGLITEQGLKETEKVFPLDVYRCGDCEHLQLLDIVNPSVLFKHYVYLSGIYPTMVNHLQQQSQAVIKRLNLKPGDLVVEFGSNDGALLQFFKKAGMRVLGVDPAENIAAIARNNGIDTIADFFNEKLALQIREKYGPAAAICANNVCAHIDDLQSVIKGVKLLLAPEGQFVFEVGYLVDVYQKTLFDTIYHEHVDFHRVAPLKRFFHKNGMSLVSAERVDIQGGALRGFARLGTHQPDETVQQLQTLEELIGLNKTETFKNYVNQINCRRDELMSLLAGLKAKGKSIAGYGSPAKAVTLMYHFGLDKDIIDFIVEDNTLKQGCYTPGFRVPILSVDALYDRKPDYVLILAWNFADPIIARHRQYAGVQSRFIVPLPNLRLVGEYT